MHTPENLDFEQIVPEYYKKVYGVLFTTTGNPDDAQDLAQETFLKAFLARGSFRGDSDVGTWLVRIALNCATDFFRKTGRVEVVEVEGLEIADKDRNIHGKLTVHEIMKRLSPGDRLLLVKYYFQDLPQEKIAEDLGISVAALKMRLKRARERFSRLYGEDK